MTGSIGGPAEWAQFGALGLVCLSLFVILGIFGKTMWGYVLKRDEWFVTDAQRREALFERSLANVTTTHEKAVAAITASVDKIPERVAERVEILRRQS